MKLILDDGMEPVDRKIAESRVINYITSDIMKKAEEWNDYTSLESLLYDGSKGVASLTDDELLNEWNEFKEDYYDLLAWGMLIHSPHEDDPIQDYWDSPNYDRDNLHTI